MLCRSNDFALSLKRVLCHSKEFSAVQKCPLSFKRVLCRSKDFALLLKRVPCSSKDFALSLKRVICNSKECSVVQKSALSFKRFRRRSKDFAPVLKKISHCPQKNTKMLLYPSVREILFISLFEAPFQCTFSTRQFMPFNQM